MNGILKSNCGKCREVVGEPWGRWEVGGGLQRGQPGLLRGPPAPSPRTLQRLEGALTGHRLSPADGLSPAPHLLAPSMGSSPTPER